VNFNTAFKEMADGREPYLYQKAVAACLFERKNLVVRAPTGAGKTLAVLAPFFFDRRRLGVRRLIYCLPLRTLASGVFAEALKGCPAGMQVTMQTGEEPGDPYFTSGDVIVTTYDQLLSGMLCGPYGLGPRRYNLNAAATVGSLVVFDEFHLMETGRAFLTATACLRIFGDLNRSVWMTATATEPLCGLLRETLSAVEVSLSSEEEQELHGGRGIRRAVHREPGRLTAKEILRFGVERTLVVVNSVHRAQNLYQDLHERAPDLPLLLLHARFFRSDRVAKQTQLNEWFGKKPQGRGIAIATQVVEAGLDLGCEYLLTELCPVNALVQRAGRCARFPGQSGMVHVYDVAVVANGPMNTRKWRRRARLW
jgi:CRISPR-associated endonuclease/helicase Cas3